MKKFFLPLLSMFFFTLQSQILKDTIVIDGEILGEILDGRLTIGSLNNKKTPTLRYDVKLFRDITKEEWSLISKKYNPGGSMMITFDIDYEYQLQSNEAIAGRLLYEAGKLKTQSNNIYIGAALIGITGVIVNSFSGDRINNGESDPSIQAISAITISTTTIMGIVGLVKSYKANRRMREAGVYFQKK